MPLKWSFNSATVMKLPWNEELKLLQEFGWRGAEVWHSKFKAEIDAGRAKSYEQLGKQMRDAGVEPTGSCVGIMWTKTNGNDPKTELADFERALDTTAAIGAPSMALIALGKVGDNLQAEHDALVEKFRKAGDLAKARNIKLNLEFLGGLPINGTLGSGIELVNATNHPNVGLLFDLVHYYVSASHLEELSSLQKGKMFCVHIDDSPKQPMESLKNDLRCWPGEGRINAPAIIKTIRDVTGYDGWYTVELYDPRVWEQDPRKVFESARKATKMIDESVTGR